MADRHQREDQSYEGSHDETADGTQEKNYHVGPKRKPLGQRTSRLAVKLTLSVIAGCLLVVLAYAMVVGDQDASPVETSVVTEFQEGPVGGGFGDIRPATAPEPEEDDFDFGPIQDQLASQRSALDARNAALQAQVQQLQDSLTELRNRAGSEDKALLADLSRALQETQDQNAQVVEQMREEFTIQMQSLQTANEERLTQQEEMLETLRRENQALQTEITTAGQNAGRKARDAEAQRRWEQQRAAEQAERRRQQQEELRARIRSEAVIYDSGARSGGTQTAEKEVANTSAQLDPRTSSRDTALRAFVAGGREAAPTEQATAIANPANTVLQGTMIQATLENAVDSSLPGAASAVVNYPVWSFDQSQVLIPSGSRLYGAYSSDVDIGQGRILVGWTRLVTPDGQSVRLSSFGGDQVGRSGIRGQVNTRFGTRFGNAALISLIGAGPSIAAGQIDDDVTSDIAGDVAEDLGNAVTSAAAEYATLPPIITVQQGSAITVMVDRDLEFF